MNKWLVGGVVGVTILGMAARKDGGLEAAGRKPPAWLTDYGQARAAARASGKPLFVVFRCEHWLDCNVFDGQVARLEPPLADLAPEFILLRLTSMRGVNLNVFDFDYDLTWAAFFLSADETVYGRYGGRDATSPDSRLSLAGLGYALQKALAAHHREARSGRAVTGPAVRTVDEYPAAVRRQTSKCIHCHHVYDFRREALQATGRWQLDELWVYPLPENVGVTLKVDEGNRVRNVAPGSAADRIGVTAGDRLTAVNGVPVASFADVQYALHRAPAQGALPVRWQRGDKTLTGNLALEDGWRRTDISWRWSLRGLEPVPWVDGEDLTAREKEQLGLSEKRLAFAQDSFVTGPARQAGIRQKDVIIGIDDKPLEMTARQFMAYVRLHYKVGDRVTYNILRDGRPLNIPLVLQRRPPF